MLVEWPNKLLFFFLTLGGRRGRFFGHRHMLFLEYLLTKEEMRMSVWNGKVGTLEGVWVSYIYVKLGVVRHVSCSAGELGVPSSCGACGEV